MQQLHQVLFRCPRPDQLRRVSKHSAGDRLPTQMVLLQSLYRLGIAEVYIDQIAANRVAERPLGFPRSWRDIFLRIDQVLKVYDRAPIAAMRQKAMKFAEEWLLARMEGSEGLGAIFPPMVYVLIVFRALGYPDDHPKVLEAQKHLKDLFIREGDMIRIQPCFSVVWDTGIALHALAEAGLDHDHPDAAKTAMWLLNKECRN